MHLINRYFLKVTPTSLLYYLYQKELDQALLYADSARIIDEQLAKINALAHEPGLITTL